MSYSRRFFVAPNALGDHFIGSGNIGRIALLWSGSGPGNRSVIIGQAVAPLMTCQFQQWPSLHFGRWSNLRGFIDNEIWLRITNTSVRTTMLEVSDPSLQSMPFDDCPGKCRYARTVPIGTFPGPFSNMVLPSNPTRVSLIFSLPTANTTYNTVPIAPPDFVGLDTGDDTGISLLYRELGDVIREPVWIRSAGAPGFLNASEVYY